MGLPEPGEIVAIHFPFSDLSNAKQHSALVLAKVDQGDLILCQITSKTYADSTAVKNEAADFLRGQLPLVSYVRPGKLFTANQCLIHHSIAHLAFERHQAVIKGHRSDH